MTPSSDNENVDIRRTFDDRAADTLLTGHDVPEQTLLSGFVAELRTLADTPAPAPSSALAALLEHGTTAASSVLPGAVPRSQVRPQRRTWALPLQLSLGAAGCLALLLGAAAANRLPAPVQTAVADVVEAVTPLELPRPAVGTPKFKSPVIPETHPDRSTTPDAQPDGHGPSDADTKGSHGVAPDGNRHEGDRSGRGDTEHKGSGGAPTEGSSPEPTETSAPESSAPRDARPETPTPDGRGSDRSPTPEAPSEPGSSGSDD